MAIKYDIVATLGSYKNANGEKKYISKNVGQMIETQHGPALVFDASFALQGCTKTEDGKIWLKLFEPRPKDVMSQQSTAANAPRQPSNGQAQPAGFDDFDDQLNF